MVTFYSNIDTKLPYCEACADKQIEEFGDLFYVVKLEGQGDSFTCYKCENTERVE